MPAEMPPAERGGVRLAPLPGTNGPPSVARARARDDDDGGGNDEAPRSRARTNDDAQGAGERNDADSAAEPIPAMPELVGVLTPRLDQRLVAEARKLLSVDEIVAVSDSPAT